MKIASIIFGITVLFTMIVFLYFVIAGADESRRRERKLPDDNRRGE